MSSVNFPNDNVQKALRFIAKTDNNGSDITPRDLQQKIFITIGSETLDISEKMTNIYNEVVSDMAASGEFDEDKIQEKVCQRMGRELEKIAGPNTRKMTININGKEIILNIRDEKSMRDGFSRKKIEKTDTKENNNKNSSAIHSFVKGYVLLVPGRGKIYNLQNTEEQFIQYCAKKNITSSDPKVLAKAYENYAETVLKVPGGEIVADGEPLKKRITEIKNNQENRRTEAEYKAKKQKEEDEAWRNFNRQKSSKGGSSLFGSDSGPSGKVSGDVNSIDDGVRKLFGKKK